MSAIAELLQHRASLLAMKASVLIDPRGGALLAGELDKDIKALDALIEKAVTSQKDTTHD